MERRRPIPYQVFRREVADGVRTLCPAFPHPVARLGVRTLSIKINIGRPMVLQYRDNGVPAIRSR